jgi:DNA-binding CsgD family transcriptional regulator
MDEQAQVDQIVSNLYAGTLDASIWSAAIDGMVGLLEGSTGILFAANPTTQGMLRDETSRGDASRLQEYRQHWIATDIRIAAGINYPVGAPQYERQLIPKSVWNKSPLLNEFLLPSDAPFMLATWVHKSAHKLVALTFQGSRRRGAFDENDGAKLQRLIPHVRRALAIRDRLEAHEVKAQTLPVVMQQSHVGVMVLDQKGRILEATGLAEQLLTIGVGMRRAIDRTLWLREPAGSLLREWIHAGRLPSVASNGSLNIGRVGLQSLSLVVAPMPEVPISWTGVDPHWLVVVFDPEQRVAPAVDMLARDLNLTAREAEIAILLSLGNTLAGIAEKLGISMLTIRTHLKHIFEKTGAHSQSDLVRRVYLSPAMQFAGMH